MLACTTALNVLLTRSSMRPAFSIAAITLSKLGGAGLPAICGHLGGLLRHRHVEGGRVIAILDLVEHGRLQRQGAGRGKGDWRPDRGLRRRTGSRRQEPGVLVIGKLRKRRATLTAAARLFQRHIRQRRASCPCRDASADGNRCAWVPHPDHPACGRPACRDAAAGGADCLGPVRLRWAAADRDPARRS